MKKTYDDTYDEVQYGDAMRVHLYQCNKYIPNNYQNSKNYFFKKMGDSDNRNMYKKFAYLTLKFLL